jgi:hypothetical protein
MAKTVVRRGGAVSNPPPPRVRVDSVSVGTWIVIGPMGLFRSASSHQGCKRTQGRRNAGLAGTQGAL